MGVRAPQLLVCRSDRPGNATAPAGWAPLTFGTTWRQTKRWEGGVAWVRAAAVRRGAMNAGRGGAGGEGRRRGAIRVSEARNVGCLRSESDVKEKVSGFERHTHTKV